MPAWDPLWPRGGSIPAAIDVTIDVTAGTLQFEIGTYNAAVYGSKIATDSAKINDGQWHHVAVTISLNSNVSFYVGGVPTSVSPLKVTGAIVG